ncbi:MAG: hypothetical protein IIX34_01700, partial [Alistipes sp.]|nr:hypothetical protein [Alistipes sp.]
MRGQRNSARGGNTLGGMQNGYGSNPYDTGVEGENGEGQPGEQQDSTKKEKKPRKPLESYFFSDSIRALRNFQWTVDRNTNKIKIAPIDTTLALWRLDYPHQHKRLGNNSVGGLGQASQEVNYFERNTSREFTFARPYEAYAYSLENVPFYNMKHPYIWMTYLESGQKRYREEHFEITASQNINPSTSFSVNYKARGAKGKYDRSRIKNQNTAVNFA